EFLEAVGGDLSGVPRLLDTFNGENVHALALPFYEGASPGAEACDRALEIVSGWREPGQQQLIGSSPVWKELERSVVGNDWFSKVKVKLANTQVAQVCYHGDFAPWNIKVAREGKWTVLDWERGEIVGIPGWDWFHFIIQPAILVKRMMPAAISRMT